MSHRRVLAVVTVLALPLAGCGGGGGGKSSSSSSKATSTATSQAASAPTTAAGTEVAGGKVTVKMSEFKFAPADLVAKAGKLTVTATDAGNAPHEFVLIKTNAAADKLPQTGGKASEKGEVGKIGEQQAGNSASHTFTLTPGHYVFICNLPGHYASGMHGTLTVK